MRKRSQYIKIKEFPNLHIKKVDHKKSWEWGRKYFSLEELSFLGIAPYTMGLFMINKSYITPLQSKIR